jgi:histidyl-tRNA synthetase
VERKSENKKKVVLGKGTSVIVQLIKDRLQGKGGGGSEGTGLLEKWIEDISLFLDPKDREFDGLLQKVKDIVESNESRRLPKLPKVTAFRKSFYYSIFFEWFSLLYILLPLYKWEE